MLMTKYYYYKLSFLKCEKGPSTSKLNNVWHPAEYFINKPTDKSTYLALSGRIRYSWDRHLATQTLHKGTHVYIPDIFGLKIDNSRNKVIPDDDSTDGSPVICLFTQ